MPTSAVRQCSPVTIDDEPQPNTPQVNMQRAQQALGQIEAIERTLLALSDSVVNDARLSTLGFVRAASLPLEVERPVDAKDLFLKPYPDDQAKQMCMGILNESGEGEDDYLDYCPREHHSTSACAHHLYMQIWQLLSWAKYPRFVSWSATESICAKVQQHQRPYFYDGHDHHPEVYSDQKGDKVLDNPVWHMTQAAYLHGKPHVRCIIAGSTIARGNEVLRSELICAVQLMVHQMKCSHYAGSIVPVMVFSIGHTNVGRITQVHFDWTSGKMVLRQTRLLNFVPASGDENDRDDEDWLELMWLFRWLEATPVGKTQIVTPA